MQTKPLRLVYFVVLIICFFSEAALGLQTVKIKPRVRVAPLHVKSVVLRELVPNLQQSIIFSNRKDFLRTPCILAEDNGYYFGGRCNYLFVRGLEERFTEYKIFREGKCYYHPCTDEFLGYEAIQVGNALLQPCPKCPDDPSKLQVVYAFERITPTDHVFPWTASSLPDVLYAKYSNPCCESGYILSVRDEYSQVGSKQVVVVSLGEREGMEVGTVLEIYKRETLRAEPKFGFKDRCQLYNYCDIDFCDRRCPTCLPCQYLGCMIIYQVAPKLSLGVILKAKAEINLLDWVVTP